MVAVSSDVELDAATSDLLCFDVGAERFALPMSSVEEIVDASDIEQASGNGAALGIIRTQGEILPVYDVTRVLQSSRLNQQPLAIVMRASKKFIAVLIDAAEATPRVHMDGLRTPHGLISSDRVLQGVLRVGTRWVGLLNHGAFVDAVTLDTALAVRMEAGTDGN